MNEKKAPRVALLHTTPVSTGPLTAAFQEWFPETELIHITTGTVEHTLITGMALIGFIMIAFLGDLRAALVVTLSVPLSLLLTFIVMVFRRDSANLISMGAIDFGIIVDASVIMVENIHRHLAHKEGRLKSARENLVAAAEEMPAEKYDFHPTEAQMTFGHLISHIIDSNNFLCSRIKPIKACAARGKLRSRR